MTPEYIAKVRHQQALIAQIAELTMQLEAATKALLPPTKKRKQLTPKEWGREVDKLMERKKTQC